MRLDELLRERQAKAERPLAAAGHTGLREAIERVFDRVVEAGVRGEAALGLGLPLTRQFIEAHGGSVELKSKKGKGTTVILTVPRGAK
jgi:signal transduction histidine kinase